MIRAQKVGAVLFTVGAATAVIIASQLSRSPGPPPRRLPPVTAIRAGSSSSNTLALGEVRGTIYAFVADEDRRSVRVFDTSKNEELAEIALEAAPGHVIVEGGSLFVSVPSRNEVREVGFPDRSLKRVFSTCDEPIALEADGPRDRLLVLCAWGHALQGFSHTTGARELEIDLPREPRAMTRAGDRLGITHAVGSMVSFVGLAGATSRSVDLSFQGTSTLDDAHEGIGLFERCIGPPQQHFVNQGYAVAAIRTDEGGTRWVLPLVDVVPMPTAAPTLEPRPVQEFSGYGMAVTPACGKVAPANGRLVVLDEESFPDARSERASGCRLPRAIARDAQTGALAVACLGDDTVQIYERGARRAIRVPAGPSGMAYDDRGRLFTWSAFDHVLSVTEPGDVPAEVAARSRRAEPPTPFELGRAIFHATDNVGVSSDGRACASCHPSGRQDGLVWGAPDGPRQTPMLVGRLRGTAPYGWNGTRDTVAGHMSQTMKRLGGVGLDASDTEAVITYLMTLEPPTTNARAAVAAPLLERGRGLFDAKGCSGCHVPASAFTDGFAHDFEAARPKKRASRRGKTEGPASREKIATFDTPSLRLVGGTAPYFHDGRYATLRDLLSDKKSTMADLSTLDAADERALEAYLETL